MFQSTAVPPAQGDAVHWREPSFCMALGLALFAFLMLWLEIVQQLRSEWSLNPQYSYGWTVPFLVGWLVYQRWPRRPVPSPAQRSRPNDYGGDPGGVAFASCPVNRRRESGLAAR